MKDTLIIYRDWWEAINGLPTNLQLEAFQAICSYAFEGKQPEDPMICAVTALMRSAIDRDKAKWEDVRKKRSEAGKRGLAKRWGSNPPTKAEPVANIANDSKDSNCYQKPKLETTPPLQPKPPKPPKENPEELSKLEEQFEAFRQRYPGNKRGLSIEFANLKKKYPKEWKDIIPLLMPAVERLIAYHKAVAEANSRGAKIFVPNFAYLSTWINNARWQDEYSEIVEPKSPSSNGTTPISRTDNDRQRHQDEFARHIITKLTTPDCPDPDITGNY